ncbi:MAG: hypothetical protein ABSH01_07030 [Terriglobia bacterium]|jgi:hypothetical protein
MSSTPHTPLPWKASDSGTGIWSAGEPLGKNKIIAICSCDAVSRPKDENTANAAFILRACNSHYELMEALEHLVKAIGFADINDPGISTDEALKAIQNVRRAQ